MSREEKKLARIIASIERMEQRNNASSKKKSTTSHTNEKPAAAEEKKYNSTPAVNDMKIKKEKVKRRKQPIKEKEQDKKVDSATTSDTSNHKILARRSSSREKSSSFSSSSSSQSSSSTNTAAAVNKRRKTTTSQPLDTATAASGTGAAGVAIVDKSKKKKLKKKKAAAAAAAGKKENHGSTSAASKNKREQKKQSKYHQEEIRYSSSSSGEESEENGLRKEHSLKSRIQANRMRRRHLTVHPMAKKLALSDTNTTATTTSVKKRRLSILPPKKLWLRQYNSAADHTNYEPQQSTTITITSFNDEQDEMIKETVAQILEHCVQCVTSSLPSPFNQGDKRGNLKHRPQPSITVVSDEDLPPVLVLSMKMDGILATPSTTVTSSRCTTRDTTRDENCCQEVVVSPLSSSSFKESQSRVLGTMSPQGNLETKFSVNNEIFSKAHPGWSTWTMEAVYPQKIESTPAFTNTKALAALTTADTGDRSASKSFDTSL